MSNKFELSESSYSAPHAQNYIEYIIKKYKTLSSSYYTIDIYTNRMNNRLVFKITDGYKLKLQTPEIIKLFSSLKKLIDKTRNRKYIPSIWMTEVILAQCALADNQYQPKFEVLFIFMFKLFYAYLLNVQPNTEFNDTIITFTDQNSRPSEIEDNTSFPLVIKK